MLFSRMMLIELVRGGYQGPGRRPMIRMRAEWFLQVAPGPRVVVDACSGGVWVAKQGMHKGAEQDRTMVEIDRHPTSLRC